jgi:hypothetical protein
MRRWTCFLVLVAEEVCVNSELSDIYHQDVADGLRWA